MRKAVKYLKYFKCTPLPLKQEQKWKRLIGLSVDKNGTLFVVDDYRHDVRRYNHSSQEMVTIAGTTDSYGVTEGKALGEATFHYPKVIQFYSLTGDGYVADWMNSSIRKLDAKTGMVSIFAKLGGNTPWLTIDQQNGLIYAVQYPERKILKIDIATGAMSLVVQFQSEYPNSGISSVRSAEYHHSPYPWCVEVNTDSPNELFVSDITTHEIFKFDTRTNKIHVLASSPDTIYPESRPECMKPAGLYYFDNTLFFTEWTGKGLVKKLDLRNGKIEEIAKLNIAAPSLVGDPVYRHCIYACSQKELFVLHGEDE